jgi:capsular polysaccharide biosynthesis protein
VAATTIGMAERNGPGAWAAVFRHRWKVLAVAVVMAVAAYVGSNLFISPTYTATTTITLSKDRPFDATASGNNAAQLGDPTQWASLQAAVVDSSQVLEAASAPVATGTGTQTVQVPAAEVDTFRDGLTVTAQTDTNQVVVTASAGSAQDAADIADAVAYAYQAYSLGNVTTSRNAALANVAASDTATTQSINLAATTYGSGVASIDAATVPSAAAAPPQAAGDRSAAGGRRGARPLGEPPVLPVAGRPAQRAEPQHRRRPGRSAAPRSPAHPPPRGQQRAGDRGVRERRCPGDRARRLRGAFGSTGRPGRRRRVGQPSRRLRRSGPRDRRHPEGTLERRDPPLGHRWRCGRGGPALQPHAVGSGVRHLVESGYLVIFVGGSVVSSPVTFAVAGEVDAVLVQVEADPRAEVVSKTLAQLSIAAPDVVAQVVVDDASSSGGGESHRLEQRPRPSAPVSQPSAPEVAGRRG